MLPSGPKVRITVDIDEDLFNAISKLAEWDDVSVSQKLESIADDYVMELQDD